MANAQRSALLAQSAEQAFAVVNDIEAYPLFLKGCRRAKILSRAGDELSAELDLVVAGIAHRVSTRNRSRPGREIAMRLVSGPARELEGRWLFEPLRGGGCRIELSLRFVPSGILARLVSSAVVERAADRVLADFLARLEALERGRRDG